MSAFVQYLVSEGFVPHQYDYAKGVFQAEHIRPLSTMEAISTVYKKGDEWFMWGLRDGIPPSLEAPMLAVAALGTDGVWYGHSGIGVYRATPRAWTERVLQSTSPADIRDTVHCKGTFLIRLDEKETAWEAEFVADMRARDAEEDEAEHAQR